MYCCRQEIRWRLSSNELDEVTSVIIPYQSPVIIGSILRGDLRERILI